MKTRLLTSAIGLIVFFAALFSNEVIFSIAVLIVALIGIIEIHNAIGVDKKLTIIGAVLCCGIFVAAVLDKLLVSLIIGLLIYMFLTVFFYSKIPLNKIYMSGFLSIVLSVSFSALAIIYIEYNPLTVLLPFVFAWITDSGAYLFGLTLGKHKLAPKLSPKKTIEGSIGGSFSCIVISVFYLWLCKNCLNTPLIDDSYITMIIVSLIASVISQFGDLSLSAIKREYEIKDYGNLLPGHGGVLDRFDSMIFVIPFVYFILSVIK